MICIYIYLYMYTIFHNCDGLILKYSMVKYPMNDFPRLGGVLSYNLCGHDNHLLHSVKGMPKFVQR